MQPHLKKCFEGIAKLQFTEEQHVTGMISSEKETVPFSKTIIPADAKVGDTHVIIRCVIRVHHCVQGMVEKWLLQVQEVMIVSLKDVTAQAVAAYEDEPRVQWVVEWPGQVVLAGTSIYWTRDVAAAIQNGTLKVRFVVTLCIHCDRALCSLCRIIWN